MTPTASIVCQHTNVSVGGSFRLCLSCGDVLLSLETEDHMSDDNFAAELDTDVESGSEVEWPDIHDSDLDSDGFYGSEIESNDCSGSEVESKDKLAYSTAKMYRYQSLSYEAGRVMRLLHLKPGKFEKDLTCSIVHADLNDRPAYEAVSYTWADENGDGTSSSYIRCVRDNTFINITKNCDAALRRIRLPDATRVVWVDSICIDQSNTVERNHQVRQMRNIYSLARQVLVYVGEETQSSREVFRYFEWSAEVKRRAVADRAYAAKKFLPSQHAIAEFLQRRWFHRIWVLQEVHLAARALMLCGERTLEWDLFSIYPILVGGLSSEALNGTTPAVLVLETILNRHDHRMLDLLHAGRNSLSTDARDKVFALLSFGDSDDEDADDEDADDEDADDEDADDKLRIQPDYARMVEWLFIDVAVQSMKNGSCLDILAYVRGESTYDSLPSWVPDWTIPVKEEPLQHEFSDAELSFMMTSHFSSTTVYGTFKETIKADCPTHDLSILSVEPHALLPQDTQARYQECKIRGTEHTSFQLDIPPETPDPRIIHTLPARLIVRAHRLATVTSIIEPAQHNCEGCPSEPPPNPIPISSSRQCSKVLEFWSNILLHVPGLENSTHVSINDGIPPAFGSQVSCPSCGPIVQNCDVVPGDVDGRGEAVYHDATKYRNSSCPNSHYSGSALAAFLLQQVYYSKGRVLFRTQGSLGLGPAALRGGESVWLIDYCSVAMALRKVGKHYVVVGECYMYGALNARYPCPRCGLGVQCAEPVETEMIEIW